MKKERKKGRRGRNRRKRRRNRKTKYYQTQNRSLPNSVRLEGTVKELNHSIVNLEG